MHRNAPLTPPGRLRLCQRIEAGWAVTHFREVADPDRSHPDPRSSDEGPPVVPGQRLLELRSDL